MTQSDEFVAKDVDTKTTLIDGHSIEGFQGLRSYLVTERREDVVRQFCRKLLGYALGREIQLSDELLLDEMQSQLQDHGFRFKRGGGIDCEQRSIPEHSRCFIRR